MTENTGKPFGAILADIISEPPHGGDPAQPTDTTESVVAAMLTENTGRHVLDSGGAYGRNFERNQGVDFAAQPTASYEARVYAYGGNEPSLDLCVDVDLYHWLVDRLEYDPELQAAWERFAEADSDGVWSMGTAEAFAESREGRGIYGDGSPLTVNTYNHDNALSQVIQYVFWTEPDGSSDERPCVLLAIHGGCDVRGGYTDYRAFRVADYNGTGILDDNEFVIVCEGEHPHAGQTTLEGGTEPERCGASWYYRAGEFEGAVHSPRWTELPGLDSYPVAEGSEGIIGTVVVTDEHRMFCPVCGAGTLTAHMQEAG